MTQERWVGWFRTTGAMAATFASAVVVGTLIAMAMGPSINASFGEMIRDPAGDGLLFPSLLGGYAVIAAGLTWLYPRVFPARPTWKTAAVFGGIVGLTTFFGGHLIVSGWSRMPFWSMAVSGVLDAIAVSAAAVVLRLAYEPGRSN